LQSPITWTLARGPSPFSHTRTALWLWRKGLILISSLSAFGTGNTSLSRRKEPELLYSSFAWSPRREVCWDPTKPKPPPSPKHSGWAAGEATPYG